MDEEPATPPRPNSILATLREHRIYGAAVGYLVAAWIVLQVAAIVLPGFGAPTWALRALMILLALGLGITVLAVWSRARRADGLSLFPHATFGRLAWVLTALLPAVLVAAFFLLRPTPRPAVAPAAPDTTAAMDKSVAVLPFDNFSEDKDSAFFADGVQDEVLTDLAHVADLKVISRSSVLQYKKTDKRDLREIGRTLGVAYVVEGSVQKAGNKIKVTAQLIDARTDAHQWAEQYVRDLADVFAIQSEIAQAIAGQLQAAISPQEHAAMTEAPTRDAHAYELYLQAHALWNDYDQSPVDYHTIIDLLKQAAASDPNFVRAYALMTEVESYQYFNEERTPETAEAARLYAEKAAQLRPGSADANVAMGYYNYYVRGDYPRAHEDFAAVVRQSANDARAYFCLGSIERRQGRWEEGLGHIHRALELDPERNFYTETYVEVLMALRRYPETQAFLDRLIGTHPQHLWLRLERAWLWLAWKADTRAARAELATLPTNHDPSGMLIGLRVTCDEYDRDFASAQRALAEWPQAQFGIWPRAAYEGDLARFRGDAPGAAAAYSAARTTLEATVRAQPDGWVAILQLAMLDASLGNRDAALEGGRRALAGAPQGDTQLSPRLREMWLHVLVRLDDREEALRTLQTLVGQPYGPDYGDLHLNPEWDPLRTDPRFVAMVASLAPKP